MGEPVLRRRSVSAVIVALGVTFFLVQLVHFVEEDSVAQVLVGVLPPSVLSLALVAAGVVLYRSDLDDRYHARVLAWTLGGMVGLAVLGAALVVYQMTHGAGFEDVVFVVVNWAATGGLVGVIVGYYNANLLRVQALLVDERDELARHQDALERQNERLERLAQVVSHDVRNPVTVAAGEVELVRETGDRSRLDRVSDALERIEHIIDDTLAMAHNGRTVQADDQRWLHLADLAEESWDGVETAEATLVVEDDLTFYGDGSRVRDVLENLFRNAVVHAGDDVTVRVGPLSDGNGFFVADDGPGMPNDRPVFRAGYSTAEEGTGLGLTIVEEIVRAHGWDVEVTESSSGGLRFVVHGLRVRD